MKKLKKIEIIIGIILVLVGIVAGIQKIITKDTEKVKVVKEIVTETDTIMVNKKESKYCIKERKKAKRYIAIIDEKIINSTNQRDVINLKYYKEKLNDISIYNCDSLTKYSQLTDSMFNKIKNTN